MPRYLVGRDADHGVTWVHSFVSDDKRKSSCVYDASSPESIRKAARSVLQRPAAVESGGPVF